MGGATQVADARAMRPCPRYDNPGTIGGKPGKVTPHRGVRPRSAGIRVPPPLRGDRPPGDDRARATPVPGSSCVASDSHANMYVPPAGALGVSVALDRNSRDLGPPACSGGKFPKSSRRVSSPTAPLAARPARTWRCFLCAPNYPHDVPGRSVEFGATGGRSAWQMTTADDRELYYRSGARSAVVFSRAAAGAAEAGRVRTVHDLSSIFRGLSTSPAGTL